MRNAQALYEKGLITYMRTDTPQYSMEFLNKVDEYITKNYGSQYIKPRVEGVEGKAHEGIRVTNLFIHSIDIEPSINKLYEFIFNITIASNII
jgi:DNA topoisomerase-1